MDDDEVSEEIEIIEYDENETSEIIDQEQENEEEIEISQIEEKITKPLRRGCCLNTGDERSRLQRERLL